MRSFLVAVAVLFLTGQSQAGLLYTVLEQGDVDVLQTIDTVTLQVTSIGPLGVPFHMGALEYDAANDVLYGLGGGEGSDTSSATLMRIDRATGAATTIGHHGIPGLHGLALVTNSPDAALNGLYAIAGSGVPMLYRLDSTTGLALTRPEPLGTLDPIGSLAYNPVRGFLIGYQERFSELRFIEYQTAGQGVLGDPNPNNFDPPSGMAIEPVGGENGTYWHIDYAGNLYVYDPEQSHLRTTVLTGLGPHASLAYAPGPPVAVETPEPTSLTLLGTATGLLVLRGRRRSKPLSTVDSSDRQSLFRSVPS